MGKKWETEGIDLACLETIKKLGTLNPLIY